MKQIELQLLRKHQHRILKKITIVSIESKELGTLIYKREFTNDYKFILNAENHIEQYPNDFLDTYPLCI